MMQKLLKYGGWCSAWIGLLLGITSALSAHGQSLPAQDESPSYMRTHAIPGVARNLVVEGPGRIWFTMPNRNAIGALVVVETEDDAEGETGSDPRGYTTTFHQYLLSTPESEPYDLVYSNGVIWFTALKKNFIGRLEVATGAIQEFPIPTPESEPTGIGVAPNGRVWYVGRKGNQIGYFDPMTGDFTEYSYPTPDAQFEALAIASNQLILATAPNLNQMVTLSLASGTPVFRHVFTTPYQRPMGIALDPSGVPWITPNGTDYLIRYAPGTLSLWRPYPAAAANGGLLDIVFKENGNFWEFWYTASNAGHAGQLRVLPNGSPVSIRESSVVTLSAQAWGIAVDPGGHVWVSTGEQKTIVEWYAPYFHFAYLPSVHR
jgi:hypothetical protein